MTTSYFCSVSVTHMDTGRASPEVSSSVKQLQVVNLDESEARCCRPVERMENCSLVSTKRDVLYNLKIVKM